MGHSQTSEGGLCCGWLPPPECCSNTYVEEGNLSPICRALQLPEVLWKVLLQDWKGFVIGGPPSLCLISWKKCFPEPHGRRQIILDEAPEGASLWRSRAQGWREVGHSGGEDGACPGGNPLTFFNAWGAAKGATILLVNAHNLLPQ